ncbi:MULTISPECIES: ABC transporter permease [unclassified Mesorhizobium]|uniref:ABC transporter permease n=1 Tax=unclassified Mesorhizobium TaxID=325217 RepID=UPI0013DEBE24|nr:MULTISPECIES: ABC transporter permease [unclassified Mesorhizobium]MCT2581259.1 ABC transporter permease [Mesorhizobium sp. P13.3]MDF3170346.1 ABC transporter permease [Mesorhizobium sp. P16.1]MDF3181401.1 ABC transporter permease [Mesorhizobium sp. P17.1]MDF3187172.1 ABC transporter permease [Mesorhizobium sp. ICCV3110.1]
MSPAALIAASIVLPPFLYVLYTSINGSALSLHVYFEVLTSKLFRQTLETTIIISSVSCIASLFLGFVIAVHLAGQPARRRAILMGLVLLPLWTSILVKCFAFTVILGREGIINTVLSWAFGAKVHLPLILNRVGTLVGMINWQVPIVALSVLASLLAIEEAIYRAAAIMGAKPARIFWTVTVPMSLPGILAGLLIIFVSSLSSFMVPALLGGPQDSMLSNLVDYYTRQVLDWPKASAISVVLVGMSLIFAGPLAIWRRRKA